jgi:hypothetical protein
LLPHFAPARANHRPMQTRPLARWILLLLAIAGWAPTASALPSYVIVPLGFLDADHTASDGSRFSQAHALTESGYALGRTLRWGSDGGGESVWLYDPATSSLLRLGFTDAEHTGDGGRQYSDTSGVTESGYVTGRSERYDGSAFRGSSAWVYDASNGTTTRLGYFDAAHTRSDGVQSSSTNWRRESGYLAGHSVRYDPSTLDRFGESAWFYDASTGATARLGLFDEEHVRDDGYQLSEVGYLTESGYATGYSNRYDGATYQGESAWAFDASTGINARLGYFDADHTRSDGAQFSGGGSTTESGWVAGSSSRYGGGAELGRTAWLFHVPTATTTRVGFFDADYVRSDGYQSSRVSALVESGNAVGTAERFAGSTYLGRSAWFYDAAAADTTRIGFLDAEHTGSGGFQDSETARLTESGYVSGYSMRFAGATSLGRSAWLYDHTDAATTRIGLFDAEHTRSDGYQATFAGLLRESGYVTGNSERYAGTATVLSRTPWIFDASTNLTTRLGLSGPEYTAPGGFQQHEAGAPTESGFVVGRSDRYSATAWLGPAAWLYDASDGTTTRIGLFDAAHTKSDGFQQSIAGLLVESGFAAGVSLRYGGASSLGQTAWIFDPTTDASHSILLSTRSDGYAASSVSFLDEGRLALGSYSLYAPDDSYLGERAFAWTPEDGALDLGGLVAGGLDAAGWSHLASALRANGLGQIIGSGRLTPTDSWGFAYLLLPVPEPGAALLLVASLGLAWRSRARRG